MYEVKKIEKVRIQLFLVPPRRTNSLLGGDLFSGDGQKRTADRERDKRHRDDGARPGEQQGCQGEARVERAVGERGVYIYICVYDVYISLKSRGLCDMGAHG